jgi:peptidoglycan/LPS O-acetylase OafA/YrhL
MTSRKKHRLAALLALVIGFLTIVEGGIVLLGFETKPYPVLPWLLRYNVVMGFASLVAGYGLWREQGWAGPLSRLVLACHGLVFLLLVGMHLLGMTVAVNSIMAMLFRTVIWIGINFMIREKEGKGQN